MADNYEGITTLLQELRRKSRVISRFYRRQLREGISEERDWPQEAEIDLIEGLVQQTTERVTGKAEISEAIWQRCDPFALKLSAPWRNQPKQAGDTMADVQEKYEYGQSKYFEGVALWVDHTLDYLKYLQASDNFSPNSAARAIILFLAANPMDSERLRLDEELREIREELERSKFRDNFLLEPRGAVRPRDLVRALLDLKPKFVHFSGHGAKSGSICMENNDGKTIELEPEAVAGLFTAIGTPIDCVMLNACYSERQAWAIPASVPYVIGMKKAIGDPAAIAFATGFYRALGAGRTVPEAFNLGLVEIKFYSIPEGLTPVLLNGADRSPDLSATGV